MRRLLACLLLLAGAAAAQDTRVTVAFIYPQDPETIMPGAYFYGLAGEAGRLGAQMAAEEAGWEAQQAGVDFRVLMANAPDAGSAGRAAQRLIGTDNVRVLIGGFEASQAAVLSQVAAENDVLFLNVASTGRAGLEPSHTLSLMPSDAAFLDAISRSASFDPDAPWLMLTQNNEASAGKLAIAQATLLADAETEVMEVNTTAPVFTPALRWLEANPEAHVLVLLDWQHQLEFASQLEASAARPDAIWVVPDSVTGTRDYLGILRNSAPESSDAILTAWDATSSGGAELNARFESHNGMPMDMPAWASYQAVWLARQALRDAPADNGAALRDHLVGLGSELDLNKDGEPAFDAESGELVQEIYVLHLQPIEPGLSTLERQRQRVEVTEVIGP